jgi:hypothetical protein
VCFTSLRGRINDNMVRIIRAPPADLGQSQGESQAF